MHVGLRSRHPPKTGSYRKPLDNEDLLGCDGKYHAFLFCECIINTLFTDKGGEEFIVTFGYGRYA